MAVRSFFITILLTALDVVWTARCGWPVWVAWSWNILSRGPLVMMTASGAMSLAHVWGQASLRNRQGVEAQSAAYEALSVALLLETGGERHV